MCLINSMLKEIVFTLEWGLDCCRQVSEFHRFAHLAKFHQLWRCFNLREAFSEYSVRMSKLRNPSALAGQLGQGSVISDKHVLCWQRSGVAEDAATENFSQVVLQPPYCWFQVSALPVQFWPAYTGVSAFGWPQQHQARLKADTQAHNRQ